MIDFPRERLLALAKEGRLELLDYPSTDRWQRVIVSSEAGGRHVMPERFFTHAAGRAELREDDGIVVLYVPWDKERFGEIGKDYLEYELRDPFADLRVHEYERAANDALPKGPDNVERD